MSSVKALLGAGVVTVLATSFAGAADMPGFPPVPVAAERAPGGDVGTGWYLRGDIGYSSNQIGGASTVGPFVSPIDNVWSSGAVLGAGAGVKLYRFRFDATFDYAPGAAYQGTSIRPGDVAATIADATALFNVYTDVLTWHGATPYVGAGVGASYLNVSNYVSAVVPPFSPPSANGRWSTTWALMGGISYAVSPNLMVDLGYRYLNLGYAETGADSVGGLSLNKLSAQQIRLGARWLFNDPMPTPEW